MKEEYYTPKIEELFVGYECEIQSSYGWQKGTWPTVLNEDTVSGMTSNSIEGILKNSNCLRTKWLTTEQIINEGWKIISDYGAGTSFRKIYIDEAGKHEGDYTLQTNKGPGLIYKKEQIIIREEIGFLSKTVDTLFKGDCKSINEFRKIVQLLNIQK